MRVEFLSEDRAEVSVYRYDYGQVLEIAGLELSNGFEVHFQNGTEHPEIRQGTVDENNVCTVAVPDITLSLGYDYAFAWVYVKTPESGTTVKTIVINILPREKPSDAPAVDDYPQIKKYADYVKENAEKVSENEAIGKQLKADAAAGLFNGKPGPQGEKGDKGDPGTTDYWKLENAPFQPVPDAPNPPELLRVPQDLEPGAYVFSEDAHIFFCGQSYYPSKGSVLYVGSRYIGGNNFENTAVMLAANGIEFSDPDLESFHTVDYDFINYSSEQLNMCFDILNKISEWLMPLFNVSPGQAVTVENADMANLTLEFSGTDLPTVLPNPNALTIKIGSESVVYDGSSAQTIEIADGNGVAY